MKYEIIPPMGKNSIRAKINQLQDQSKVILESNDLKPEVRFFISSMISILEVIVAVLLEKKTRKNSSNSGLPPSKNDSPNGNRNKGSDEGKKLGEQIANTRNVETHEQTSPLECTRCKTDLTSAQVLETESRKKVDIIYEVVTSVVTAETKECP